MVLRLHGLILGTLMLAMLTIQVRLSRRMSSLLLMMVLVLLLLLVLWMSIIVVCLVWMLDRSIRRNLLVLIKSFGLHLELHSKTILITLRRIALCKR